MSGDLKRPLADRMRPLRLAHLFGQDAVTGPGSLIRHAIENDRIFSMILWGPPGCGKTTLLRQLLPILQQRGLHVAVVKHAHHAFEVDQPGKDSYEHRRAGATEVLVTSNNRWALMHELRGAAEPPLPITKTCFLRSRTRSRIARRSQIPMTRDLLVSASRASAC